MLSRILLAGLLASALVFGQRGGGGAGSRGSGGSIPNIGFGGGTPFDRVSEIMKLSKDQKKDFKAALDDAQKEATPIHEQILKSRQAIAEAVVAGTSQDDLSKAITAEGALEAQMAELELRTYVKIRGGLENDQKARTATLFLMLRGIFSKKNWNAGS